MPFYDLSEITNSGFSVKLQVTPDEIIMKDIASEFEEKMTDMVNYIMKQTVSLQVRDIFVLYLPNKQRNGRTYYVFYKYLYNSTGNIEFSEAITETKNFVARMKSQAVLTLSNGMNLGLKIRFAHQIRIVKRSFIDLSVGESLVLMNKTAWERRIQRPDFEISDVHWCYRTDFSLRDTKVLGRGVVEILVSPPVTVYETEIESSEILGKIYICIDLVVTPTAREGVNPARNTEGNLDIVDDKAQLGVLGNKGGVLVVSCVVLAIFGIIFFKVRAHVRSAKRKINMDMLTNQAAIELDTINGHHEQGKDNFIIDSTNKVESDSTHK